MLNINRPRWKEVEYSRSKIIRAGKAIRNENLSQMDLAETVKIIDNWRAAHAYPLHVIYIRLRDIAAERPDIIVAERLKRLSSIINKLKREPTMSLWEVQDLGGCRFIVPTIDEVYSFAKKYGNSHIRHKFINSYDYIKFPKSSGYRSLHLVFKFHSDTKETYNRNMLIELQFRTHLQHIWATAVETLGLFTGQALKAGEGDTDINRFFVLVSSLFALRENMPVVPGTISESNELISEIKEIDSRRHFLDTLSAIRVAINHEDLSVYDKKGYYILILNYKTRHLHIRYFTPSQVDEANTVYSKIEYNRADSQIDAVLVRVSSFQTLKIAYPNYFLDIGEFVDTIKHYLE